MERTRSATLGGTWSGTIAALRRGACVNAPRVACRMSEGAPTVATWPKADGRSGLLPATVSSVRPNARKRGLVYDHAGQRRRDRPNRLREQPRAGRLGYLDAWRGNTRVLRLQQLP